MLGKAQKERHGRRVEVRHVGVEERRWKLVEELALFISVELEAN